MAYQFLKKNVSFLLTSYVTLCYCITIHSFITYCYKLIVYFFWIMVVKRYERISSVLREVVIYYKFCQILKKIYHSFSHFDSEEPTATFSWTLCIFYLVWERDTGWGLIHLEMNLHPLKPAAKVATYCIRR